MQQGRLVIHDLYIHSSLQVAKAAGDVGTKGGAAQVEQSPPQGQPPIVGQEFIRHHPTDGVAEKVEAVQEVQAADCPAGRLRRSPA